MAQLHITKDMTLDRKEWRLHIRLEEEKPNNEIVDGEKRDEFIQDEKKNMRGEEGSCMYGRSKNVDGTISESEVTGMVASKFGGPPHSKRTCFRILPSILHQDQENEL
ncbi:hypothetical protein H5410_060804 [Solanum commersonii]|uniref:Uncharacterized protein n=1 Tax=Solanum commersonii TaxID=4109 RepID=A0A9J5W7N2_SOLCO|nr:hypothetical protein H5410_060804 [Solanum commersonii]